MTGYGKASAEYRGKKITAEVKSLNSKALDLSTRMQNIYREKEMEVRQLISQQLERGKVDFYLWYEQTDTMEESTVNEEKIMAYHAQLRGMAARNSIPEPQDWWSVLMRMPDVISRNEVQELSDEEWSVALGVIEQALSRLIEFRKQEGRALQAKFEEKLDNIARLMNEIEPFEAQRTEKIRQRLLDGLKGIPNVEYDPGRLEQEMIFYIEKLDISEEKQRLANHLQYCRTTMQDGHGQGKKLGFIAQEMGREINTTGSKSNQAEMQNIVVRMKDELEQIKEQVLNVL